MRRRARNRLVAAIGPAVVSLLVVVAPAGASSVGVSGPTLLYSTDPGEQNQAVIRVVDGSFEVEDTGPGVTMGAGPGCSVQGDTATCTMAGVTSVEVGLGGGDDTLRVETALPSALNGAEGADSITGGPGPDVIDGGEGNDVLMGGAGDDALRTGGAPDGGDIMSGGPGRDSVGYSARSGGVSVTLDGVANDGAAGEGDNVGGDLEDVTGSAGNDVLVGGVAANALAGGPGSDSLAGGAEADVLDGGDGDDQLDGGDGGDTIGGGSGIDTVSYAGVVGTPVSVSLDAVANDGPLGSAPDAVLGDVENAVGGPLGDDLAGGGGANTLDGGTGEDFVDGGLDTDALAGGEDPDVVRARDGGADTVDCGPGRDLAITDRGDRVQGCEHVAFTGRAPQAARTVVIAPVRSRASQAAAAPLFAPRGMSRLVSLQDRITVPVRSRLDVSRGIVSLTASSGKGKRVERGRFAPTLSGRPDRRGVGSEVLVNQTRGRRPVLALALKGGSFRDCRVRALADVAQRRNRTRRSRRVVRRLFGRARGRFRTRGRFSAATVRGTTWSVEDRCDGTLTRVRRGRVTVTDTVRRRTVTLRAGDSYLSTPRGTRPQLRRKGR